MFRLLTNFEDAEREYQGLQIEANRAFRDGWVIRTNYTLSKVEGNAIGQEHFNNTIDDFREAQTVPRSGHRPAGDGGQPLRPPRQRR